MLRKTFGERLFGLLHASWKSGEPEKRVVTLKQATFGCKREKQDPGKLELALEDQETTIAAVLFEQIAENRADHRARKPGLWLWRWSAPHWRRRVRAAGRDPGPVPGDCHPPPQKCLPVLHRRRGPGTGARSADRRRVADRGHGRPCAGQQVCRSPSALSLGADLQPPGC